MVGHSRNEEIEALRGMAIVGVVVLHSLSLIAYQAPSTPLSATSLFVILAFGFAVPFFFIISGYVLYLRYPRCDQPLEFIKKRLLAVLPAYMLFSIVYSLYSGQWSLADSMVAMATFSASGHLWFVGAIICFYVFYPAIVWMADRLLRENYLALVLLSGVVQLAYYFLIRDLLPGPLASVTSFLGYVLYFSLGIYLARTRGLRAEARSVPVVGASISLAVVLAIIMTFSYYQMGAMGEWSKVRELLNPLLVVSMLVALYSAALRLGRSSWGTWMKRLGSDSYGIYLVHALMISVIGELVLYPFLNMDEALFFLVLVPMVLLSSLVIIELMGKNKAINKVLRVRKE